MTTTTAGTGLFAQLDINKLLIDTAAGLGGEFLVATLRKRKLRMGSVAAFVISDLAYQAFLKDTVSGFFFDPATGKGIVGTKETADRVAFILTTVLISYVLTYYVLEPGTKRPMMDVFVESLVGAGSAAFIGPMISDYIGASA